MAPETSTDAPTEKPTEAPTEERTEAPTNEKIADPTKSSKFSIITFEINLILLCGVLIKEEDYETVRQAINTLKHSIWGNKEVIFHSRDIRKCEKEFQKLFLVLTVNWF